MKAGKSWHFLVFFLCLFSWQNSVSAQISSANPENKTQIKQDGELDLIHLGDLIEVEVIGVFGYNWRGTLTPEGLLNGPDNLTERVFGLCRSESEVAADLTKGYAKFLRDPKVAVRILDRSNRPNSTLFGAVKIPQRVQIKRPVNLNELIILAGGFTDKASGEIQIFRPASLSCGEIKENAEGDSQTRARYIAARQDNGSQYINIRINELLSGKKESNVQILAGDIVTVLEAKPIYVIGGVVSPKQIATRSQMTVSRAVAIAGGLTKSADAKRVTVFRRAGRETKIIETDLDKIKANPAEDVVLEAYDIVEVSEKGNAKRKYPPVIKTEDSDFGNSSKLPLRIID